MANEEHLGRAGRCLERALSVFNLILTHTAERSSGIPLVASFAL